jgi:hypothetical protein
MGVPRLFRLLCERYPCILQDHTPASSPEFDNLYLDFNGVSGVVLLLRLFSCSPEIAVTGCMQRERASEAAGSQPAHAATSDARIYSLLAAGQ